MATFTVTTENIGQRLDLFVTLQAAQYSRSHVRQMLDEGKIKVGGKVEYRPNYKMAKGDEVELDTESDVQLRRMTPYEIDLEVLYQDEDILLLNKPSGLKVHPTSAADHLSLINAVYYLLADKLTDYGATLINRIDKDTSGVVAVALSPKGAWFYSKQFAESKVKKEYAALVDGMWISKYGFEEIRISNFLQYDSLRERQVISSIDGEFAETKFKLIKTSEDKSVALLAAVPTTGRTHQIRVHLEALGFPILGDVKYSGVDAIRLMLHAYKLSLPKASGGTISVTAELPPEFRF